MAAGGFDLVHVAYAPFPADPRVRREALVGQAVLGRVAVIALADAFDAPGEEEWDGMTIIRLAGRKRRGSIAQYIGEYGSFIRRARRILAADPRFAAVRVVHCHSLPDFIVYAALPARRRGARIVLDLHEVFPEFARAKYGPRLGPVLERVARGLERWSRRQADVTLTVTRPIEQLFARRAVRPTERVYTIHNSPDPADFGPRQPPRQHAPGRSLRLVFHGTLTPVQGVDLGIAAIAAARERGLDATLTIYGAGPQLPALEALVDRLALGDHVTFHRPIGPRALRTQLLEFDAGYVPTRADEMTRWALSTKMFEYVHLGLPVITTRLATYTKYFPESSAVFV
ncbi:MAG TPA: glycosyltransferase, partial [Gemmatimonadaceae bacterium]|nr:glycosyltransferase [Gemmatimonadaceae bacterium]